MGRIEFILHTRSAGQPRFHSVTEWRGNVAESGTSVAKLEGGWDLKMLEISVIMAQWEPFRTAIPSWGEGFSIGSRVFPRHFTNVARSDTAIIEYVAIIDMLTCAQSSLLLRRLISLCRVSYEI